MTNYNTKGNEVTSHPKMCLMGRKKQKNSYRLSWHYYLCGKKQRETKKAMMDMKEKKRELTANRSSLEST